MVIFFVEVPFCVTCCANQTIQNLVKTFSENRTKSFMYVVMAFIMWLAVWKAATFWSVMTGLLLTATMVFYGTFSPSCCFHGSNDSIQSGFKVLLHSEEKIQHRHSRVWMKPSWQLHQRQSVVFDFIVFEIINGCLAPSFVRH